MNPVPMFKHRLFDRFQGFRYRSRTPRPWGDTSNRGRTPTPCRAPSCPRTSHRRRTTPSTRTASSSRGTASRQDPPRRSTSRYRRRRLVFIVVTIHNRIIQVVIIKRRRRHLDAPSVAGDRTTGCWTGTTDHRVREVHRDARILTRWIMTEVRISRVTDATGQADRFWIRECCRDADPESGS